MRLWLLTGIPLSLEKYADNKIVQVYVNIDLLWVFIQSKFIRTPLFEM